MPGVIPDSSRARGGQEPAQTVSLLQLVTFSQSLGAAGPESPWLSISGGCESPSSSIPSQPGSTQSDDSGLTAQPKRFLVVVNRGSRNAFHRLSRGALKSSHPCRLAQAEEPARGAQSSTMTPASPWEPRAQAEGHSGGSWPQPSRTSRLCPAAIYSQLQMLAPQRTTDRRTEGSSVAAQTLPALFFGKDFPTQPCDPFGSHPGWWSWLSSRGTRLGRENISFAVCPRSERRPYQAQKNQLFQIKGLRAWGSTGSLQLLPAKGKSWLVPQEKTQTIPKRFLGHPALHSKASRLRTTTLKQQKEKILENTRECSEGQKHLQKAARAGCGLTHHVPHPCASHTCPHRQPVTTRMPQAPGKL